MSDAERVSLKKKELDMSNNAESTKRQKLTAYIRDLKSRQDFRFRFRGKDSFNFLRNFPKLIFFFLTKLVN